MAGANNAQMKARGWKAADITRYRASHSGPMSDAALRRAGALPKQNSHAHKALAETIRQNRPATPAKKTNHVQFPASTSGRPNAAATGEARRDIARNALHAAKAMRKAESDVEDSRDDARRFASARVNAQYPQRPATKRKKNWVKLESKLDRQRADLFEAEMYKHPAFAKANADLKRARENFNLAMARRRAVRDVQAKERAFEEGGQRRLF